MLEKAENGVSYGVEVKYHDDPRASWYTRYGWFEEDPEDPEHSGLERARLNLRHALKDYPVARIVKRTVSVEVVE